MSTNNNHIIQKQIFSLTLRESKDSAPIQQRVSNIYKKQVMTLLDDLFSRLVPETEMVQIKKLEIDLGSIAPNELEQGLPEKIIEALEKQIQKLVTADHPELLRQPLSKNRFSAWLGYLEKGVLPEGLERIAEIDLQSSVLDNLSSNKASLQQLRKLIVEKEIALDRLTKQYEESFLNSLLSKAFIETKLQPRSLRKQLEKVLLPLSEKKSILLFNRKKIFPDEIYQVFWKQLINLSFQNNQWPTSSTLVIKILETLNEQVEKSLPLQQLIDAIEHNANPIPVFKSIVSSLEIPFPKIEKKEDSVYKEEDINLPTKQAIDSRESTKSIELELPKEQKEEKKPELSKEEKEATQKLTPEEREKLMANLTQEEAAESTITEVSQSNQQSTEKKRQKEATKKLTPKEKEKLMANLIQEEATENTIAEVPQSNQQSTEKEKEKKKQSRKEWKPLTQEAVPDDTSYYVPNAGIVLLHPFLKTFFGALEMLTKGQFVDLNSQEKAIHLLHFLATGDIEPPEFQLVLPKFLGGLLFNYPIARKVLISEAEKKEGEHLLQMVIDHWGALGNVDPDSIREGFLQRSGKLEKRPSGWYLQVERKTIDILLGKLSWGIGVVKLPWMEEVLNVEWE